MADRYNLPLICTGMEPDITHCSWLHRQSVEQCDTEFYKPLDYDDQLCPEYLARAIETIERRKLDVYGCLLLTLQAGQFSPRWWPNKPLEGMFTGNSNDNQLPHSSALLRVSKVRQAGNYQERAVGLGADDYHLWYRLHQAGARFYRDDDVRHVVYRIHEKNSLPIRKARYGSAQKDGPGRGALIAGATAASVALWVAPNLTPTNAAVMPPALDTPAAQSSTQNPLSDLTRQRSQSVTKLMLSGVEQANALLKQKFKSALQKVLRTPAKQSPDRPAANSPIHHNDLLPPHS